MVPEVCEIYIGPDVINKFTLILLNKNPKMYESIIRIGDWSQPYDFNKRPIWALLLKCPKIWSPLVKFVLKI